MLRPTANRPFCVAVGATRREAFMRVNLNLELGSCVSRQLERRNAKQLRTGFYHLGALVSKAGPFRRL